MGASVGKGFPENRLLASLDEATRAALADTLTPVDMQVRDVVYEDRKPFDYAYFPIDCVISMVAVMDGAPDSMIEVATIGHEGMVGLPVFLGADLTPGRCFAQVNGNALRMPVADLRAAASRHGSFSTVLHRYTQSLLVQISQSTGCNRAHAIQQRCARWILMTHDRVCRDEFLLTQEFLSQMLGERRPAVNAVASAFQAAGYIRYSRGRMNVVDRRGLEVTTCGCYGVIREEYERMFGELAGKRSR